MIHRPVLTSLILAGCSAFTVVATDFAINASAHAAEGKQASTAANSAGAAKSAGKAETKASASAYAGPPVLDPTNYFGSAAMGYASAKAAPEVMAHLFCYCGCDATDKHSQLLDCFTSTHGVDCHICQEEAVHALKLHREGVAVAEIQKQIDELFAHHYPFTEDTDTYKKYKAGRMYAHGAGVANGGANPVAGPMPAGSEVKTGDASSDGKSASKKDKAPKSALGPKVKPGRTVGNCCGEHK